MTYPKSLDRLIYELRKLPTVGNKMAVRLAFNLISRTDNLSMHLADAMVAAKRQIRLCRVCFGISEMPICDICDADNRDQSTVTVVRHPQNIFHIEQTGAYHGLYHVLHGVISPMEGVTPEHLNIKPLVKRVDENKINELIIALSLDVEGEATANYIGGLLKDRKIKITRPGIGLPFGSDIEYVDPMTIAGALHSRTHFS